jgi:hypothetical protein
MVHAVVAGEITIEMFVDFVPADLSERFGDRVQAVTTLRSGIGDLRSAIAKGAIIAATLREADTTPKRSSSGTASTPSSAKRARLSQGSAASSDWSEQSEIGQEDAVLMTVQVIGERFPDADPNMLYNRLVDAADLDAARDAIIQELLVCTIAIYACALERFAAARSRRGAGAERCAVVSYRQHQ